MAPITITVTNADWSVLSDLKQALVDAQISSAAVFSQVQVTTTRKKADSKSFTASPLAVVQYLGTDESTPDDTRLGLAVRVEILLASKASASISTEDQRSQEALRLVNAAKNAIEARPPTLSCGFAGHIRRVEWGSPDIDTGSTDPWIVATLPLTVAVPLAGRTSR